MGDPVTHLPTQVRMSAVAQTKVAHGVCSKYHGFSWGAEVVLNHIPAWIVLPWGVVSHLSQGNSGGVASPSGSTTMIQCPLLLAFSRFRAADGRLAEALAVTAAQ